MIHETETAITTSNETAAPIAEESEEMLFASCMKTVKDGMKTFIEVGAALEVIREKRLYRKTHSTFQEFLDQEFDYSRHYAHRLIEAAKVAKLLLPIGNIPNEGAARELGKVEQPERERIVRELKKEKKPITAKNVKAKRPKTIVEIAKEIQRPAAGGIAGAYQRAGISTDPMKAPSRQDPGVSDAEIVEQTGPRPEDNGDPKALILADLQRLQGEFLGAYSSHQPQTVNALIKRMVEIINARL